MADHQVRPGLLLNLHKHRYFIRLMLTVRVQRDDPRIPMFERPMKSCQKGCPLPPVDSVADDYSPAALGNLLRPIAGAVIHNKRRKVLDDLLEHAFEPPRFIPGRD